MSTRSFDAKDRRRSMVKGPRRWGFRLAAVTMVPVLFFAALESGLRLGGYGYPTGFFIKSPAPNGYLTNPRFGWRFFPRRIARGPHPAFVQAPKAAQTYRIVVLGGSAAMGYPQEELNFGRILQAMLTQRFPNARFEVINAAVTAVNSHAVLPAIKDCARLEPDLFIIYLGNNEVVGPFGPGTVFADFSPNLSAIRATLWIKSTKIGQLADHLAAGLSRRGKITGRWRGMAMMVDKLVPADHPRLERTYQHFGANLLDICRVGRRAGPVLLCTVATNLKDSAPFASQHRAGLGADALAQWQRHYDMAVKLEGASKFAQAMDAYQSAAAIDDAFADLHFRLARCLEAGQSFGRAKEHYLRARDLDALRFRADTRINTIIREMARRQQKQNVHLVDIEGAFENSAQTEHGIVGRSLLYEHVHMNFEGNYVAAGALFENVVSCLPQSIRQQGVMPPAVPNRDQCAEALALTGWDLYEMVVKVNRLTGQAPFSNRLDHLQQSVYNKQQQEELQKHLAPDVLNQSVDAFRQAIARYPDDVGLRLRFALLLEHLGIEKELVEHRRFIVERIPNHANAHLDLGSALYQSGRADEAIKHFRQALRIKPWFAMAHNNLGFALEMEGKLDAAIGHYHEALRINPDLAMAHNNLGVALRSKGKGAQAIEHFHQALRIDPNYREAQVNLEKMQGADQK